MAPTVTTSKKSAKSSRAVSKEPSEDMLDRFHDPEKKVCTIIATNTTQKVDKFYEYRPKTSKEFLTYNISQTCAKMDCGPTKILIEQTHAEYERFPPGYVFVEPEPPPPKKRKHAQHGRGPVWLYLDEIYKKKAELKQAVYHRAMEIRQRRKTKAKKAENHAQKERVTTRGGPSWFQELSPQQLSAVDNLSNALEIDIKNGTIEHVQDVVAKLGLVLRPNHCHVKWCIDHCCHNPVEFLLMLYQLINPKGKPYTLNDRLLLSAVVHLSMTTMLRELHIRIPSPPPERHDMVCIAPVQKKVKKYKSPYLVPFTYEPEPPKHKGTYQNNHIQYPESRYFCYLEELREEIGFNNMEESDEDECSMDYGIKYDFNDDCDSNYNEGGAVGKELDEERMAAQVKYNHLTKRRNVPRLLRPSIYKSCPQELSSTQSITQRIENYDEYLSRSIIRDAGEDGIGEGGVRESDMMVCAYCEPDIPDYLTAPTTSDNPVYVNPQYNEDTRYTQDGDDAAGSGSSTSGQVESVPESIPPKIPETNSTMISGGITFDKDGNPVPIICGIVSPRDMVCKCNVDPSDAGPLVNPEALPKDKKYVCKCKKKLEKEERKKRELEEKKRVQRELCTCEMCLCANRISSSSSELSSLGSFVPPSDDLYQKDTTEKLLEVKEPPPFHCQCKDIVQQQIDEIKGRMTCTETCHKKKPTFIVADTKLEEGEDGDEKAIKIISAVKAPKTCTCMERYFKDIEKFEKEKRNEMAQLALRSTERSFVISGIKQGPDGKPIYMLSGIAQDRFCNKCEELMDEEKREQERMANMPPFPQGRQKYVISGVRDTPAGKAYIISGAIPMDDCDCMRLYETFMRQHSRCIQLYDRYMQKIQSDTEEYMSDLQTGKDAEADAVVPEESAHSIDESHSVESSASATPVEDDVESEKEHFVQIRCACAKPADEPSGGENNGNAGAMVDGDMRPIEDLAGEGQGHLGEDAIGTTGGEPVEEIVPDASNNNNQSDKVQAPQPDKDKYVGPPAHYDGNRFILLKKIPCDSTKQIAIVKKALKVLAEDGFPLAKLPNCHKLPHFKLWMDLRCGRHYTQADRIEFAKASKEFWAHVAKCKKTELSMTLDISPQEARTYSWSEAKAVKKMTDDFKEKFCRTIKQSVINDGREFFTSMFDYELPTKSFRDCYFAYTPPKEEAVFGIKPWNAFEYTDFKLIRSHRGQPNRT